MKSTINKLGLFGGGGHADEVEFQLQCNWELCKVDFWYVDDKYVTEKLRPISEYNYENTALIVAVGDSKKRFDVVCRLPKNTTYYFFIHPTVVFSDSVEFGVGGFIGAYSVLTTNIIIGEHCLLNRGVHIGHDCVIGDFFSAMPGAVVSGNVNIGNRVYLGNNSSIREKITICDDVIIGMNSAVVKNITEPGTYAGVPAKKIK